MHYNNHFLLIGGEKAGTTWLQHVFDTDPRVCTSFDQEVGYLNKDSTFGTSGYQEKFRVKPESVASVDVSPAYMDDYRTIGNLSVLEQQEGFAPKIIVVLREPVSRAFSAYQMKVNYGRQYSGFLSALSEDFGIRNRSLYGKHLSRWIDEGYGERMHVILFDDLVGSPYEVLRSLSAFMGLEMPLSDRYLGCSINSGGIDKVKKLTELRQRGGAALRRVGLHRLIHALKTTFLVQWIDKANKKKVMLDAESEREARKIFSEDVDRLDRLFPGLDVKKRWGYCS